MNLTRRAFMAGQVAAVTVLAFPAWASGNRVPYWPARPLDLNQVRQMAPWAG